tara:strand:+ start:2768 stop:4447 length:1680 start_codon:yes stop_codon:yes gene_type:complete
MKTSISTLKVNQKAQKSVDTAESSINRFKRFLSSRKVGNDIPQNSEIQRAQNFITKFEPVAKGGGLMGNLMKGAGALILLPMLLAKGAMAGPMDVTSHMMGAYGGDKDAVQKDVQKAQQTKDKAKDDLDKTTESGKDISKSTVENVKNIDKDKKQGKLKPEDTPSDVEESQEALSQESPEKIEAMSGTSDVGELDVTVKDTNRFAELIARFEKLTKAGSFMEGKPEVVGGGPGQKVKRMGAGLLDALTFNAFDFDKKNKKRKEGKDEEVTEVPIKITKASPQEDMMGQKKPTSTGSMDTESEDFAALTAVSALEGGDSQSRADVAQSIYNRHADGYVPGGSIKDVVTADGQYQPAYKDPNVSEGPGTKTSKEFKNITDRKSAVVAMMSYYERRGQDVTRKQMEELYDKTAADLQNPELQSEAAKHVGGRTEFLGGKVEGSDVVDRGGYEDNAFFQEYGSGKQMERGAVDNPLLTSDASQVEGRSIDKSAPEQYPEYDVAQGGGGGQPTILALPPEDAPSPKPTPSMPQQAQPQSPEFIPLGEDSATTLAMMQIQGLGAS